MFFHLFRGFRPSPVLYSKKSLYTVLGVAKSASESEIKQAYFSLAKKLHPDINKEKNAKDQFSELSQAYETLGSPSKRRQYDLTGLNSDQQEEMRDAPRPERREKFYHDDFEEMIEQLNGMFKERPKKKAKGKDINLNLTIDFMESVQGANKRVKITRKEACQSCQGSKKNKHESGKRCKYCYGRGFVLLDLGFAKFEQACAKCMGTGSTYKNKCNCCKGSGLMSVDSYESVKIPPGIDSGCKLKVQSRGHASENGGAQGDLYVKISVLAHKVFKRMGNDLFADVFITLPQAVLGGLVEVSALDGNLNLKIEPGVESGKEIRVWGLGVANFPKNLNEKGDLVYTVYVKSPRVLSLRQRLLYEELENAAD